MSGESTGSAATAQVNAAVTGVILAGGMGRRMQGADKGLVVLQQAEMISWVIDTLRPSVAEVVINANRNLDDYKKYAVQVVPDSIDGYQGPLAGFEAGMSVAKTQWIYTCPCDSPMQSPLLLPHMFNSVTSNEAEIGVASDGNRTHPVFSLVKTDLLQSLRSYLASGERKIDRWFAQHKLVEVDCSEFKQSFVNINTEEDLKNSELSQMKLTTKSDETPN